MAKVADKYFEVDQWKIIENGFDPDYGQVSESIFSLGNEYMGVRGYFEEGYSGAKLIGSYFNGIYERTKPDYSHYKGIADFTEYMVNSLNWLYAGIEVDGEKLDLATADIEGFVRVLDLKTGLLTRKFVWNTKSGKKIELAFERFLSMTDVEKAAQKIEIKSIDGDAEVNVEMGLDFSQIHNSSKRSMWRSEDSIYKVVDGDVYLGILARTVHTKQKVFGSCRIEADYVNVEEVKEEKIIAAKMQIKLPKNETKTITKIVNNLTLKDGEDKAQFQKKVDSEIEAFGDKGVDDSLATLDYDKMEIETVKWWENVWKHSDIVIEGDDENQQGIRFCIFQLFQTYHGAVKGTNIGAKGLTGEAYNGNAFWDTETYCLPFFLFNNREAAKNLLYFRYKTLDEARKRAEVLDCKGAFYPIATISGKECCNLWQHASLQLQASTAVAYGIWFYEKMFKDDDFMNHYGLEMLIEISRMLATRGDYSQDGKYGYYCVMGPDEFQMMVNNNCYTNYMGKFTLEYTLKKLAETGDEYPEIYKTVTEKVAFTGEEAKEWKNIADNMYIPYDEKTKLFEQNDGFFEMPHVDVDKIPITDFPLYDNWSYDRIYRNDMIKQPDVLMFMLLFNSQFSNEQLRANYEYYEPRCIHESSLSPSVHSILASQLHKEEEAYDFFGFATRMDLDNYNRNTNQGIHTTSIAAAWMNIVYGFGGLRTDGEDISISPSIPKDWNKYSFKIGYDNEIVEVTVSSSQIMLKTQNGKKVQLKVYDELIDIDGKGHICALNA